MGLALDASANADRIRSRLLLKCKKYIDKIKYKKQLKYYVNCVSQVTYAWVVGYNMHGFGSGQQGCRQDFYRRVGGNVKKFDFFSISEGVEICDYFL